jgi:hypothetical protein
VQVELEGRARYDSQFFMLVVVSIVGYIIYAAFAFGSVILSICRTSHVLASLAGSAGVLKPTTDRSGTSGYSMGCRFWYRCSDGLNVGLNASIHDRMTNKIQSKHWTMKNIPVPTCPATFVFAILSTWYFFYIKSHRM